METGASLPIASESKESKATILPQYIAPSSKVNMKGRAPIWTWKKRVEAVYWKSVEKFALLPSSTAQEIARLFKEKCEFLKVAIRDLCPQVSSSTGMEDFFTIEGVIEPTWKYLYDRCTERNEAFLAVGSLISKLQAEPGDDQLLEMAHRYYSAWNPIDIIVKTFFAVFRPVEAKLILFTANERWLTMKRKDVMNEWSLLVQDSTFVLRYDKVCVQVALLVLKGSMAMRELHLHGLKKSKKNLDLLAADPEGAGAGADDSFSLQSLETSVFYCMYKEMELWEVLYDHCMADFPFSDGFMGKHPDWLAMSTISAKPMPELSSYQASVEDLDREL